MVPDVSKERRKSLTQRHRHIPKDPNPQQYSCYNIKSRIRTMSGPQHNINLYFLTRTFGR